MIMELFFFFFWNKNSNHRIDKSIQMQTEDRFWDFIVLTEFIIINNPFFVECRIDSEHVHTRNEFDSNFDQN